MSLSTDTPGIISIHAPHAGSDAAVPEQAQGGDISIHAPHAGSDLAGYAEEALAEKFQSTLPMRGATLVTVRDCGARLISIHAPHAGSDFAYVLSYSHREFQSTLPMRGATISIPPQPA